MATPTPDSYTFTPGTPLYAGLPTPSGGTLLTSFSLDNWDSVTPTRTLFRGGMPFKKGDVPSGSVPEIRRAGGAPVVAQFDERTTWSDGSLKFAVCHMRDTNLAASGTQAYQVYSVTGSYNNTGTKTLASIVATDAITVELSSFAQWNGTSSATRGSGAALLDVAALSTVATRVTKIHSGPVCETYQIWGMFKDGADGSGSEDAHAKGIVYLSVWKDVSDAVADTEYGVELAQDWWGVATKFRLDYTATLKRNGTTVQAYTGIQHPYQCHWMMARMGNDNNHGKRHWVGDVPTLTYLFDKDYWVSTKVMVPFDTTFTPDSNTTATLVPLSAQDHRASLDSTGGYQGRGLLPNIDAKTFMRQTPADFRASRVNAFAGLHVNRHFRDERTRTRSGESADVANTLIPLLWEPKLSSASTFTGLPTPKHAYKVTDLGGFVAPTGGTGVWSNSDDPSHAVQYSAFMYLVEGERYFLETCIDLATYNAHATNANEFGGKPFIQWYLNTAARSEMSIPSTRWSGTPNLSGQERNLAWAINQLTAPAALVPDGDPQGEYMRAWNEHLADYLVECVNYTPPSCAEAGLTYSAAGSSASVMRSPWMTAIIVQCLCQNFLATETVGHKTYANMVARSLAAFAARNLYDLQMYRVLNNTQIVDYSAGNWLASHEYLAGPEDATVVSDVLTMTGSGSPGQAANGDSIYFIARNSSAATIALPAGYTAGTELFAIDVSGATFKVSTSPGGSVFSVPNGSYQIGGRFTGRAAITVAANPPYLPPADSYTAIQEAAFAMAEIAGLSNVPAGTFTTVRAFLANADRTDWPAWVLKVPEVAP